jgi:hypothetical protein
MSPRPFASHNSTLPRGASTADGTRRMPRHVNTRMKEYMTRRNSTTLAAGACISSVIIISWYNPPLRSRNYPNARDRRPGKALTKPPRCLRRLVKKFSYAVSTLPSSSYFPNHPSSPDGLKRPTSSVCRLPSPPAVYSPPRIGSPPHRSRSVSDHDPPSPPSSCRRDRGERLRGCIASRASIGSGIAQEVAMRKGFRPRGAV